MHAGTDKHHFRKQEAKKYIHSYTSPPEPLDDFEPGPKTFIVDLAFPWYTLPSLLNGIKPRTSGGYNTIKIRNCEVEIIVE